MPSSCCHVNRVSLAISHLVDWYCTLFKYEADKLLNKKITRVSHCCYGNMVSLATNQKVNWYFPNRPVYYCTKLTCFERTKL